MGRIKLFFKEHSERQICLIPLICFLLFGVPWLIAGIGYWQKEIEITNWPCVTGTIVVSRITQHEDDDGDIHYQAYYNYEYEVNGQKFVTDAYSFSEGTGCYYLEEEAIENKLKIGTEVSVFYNPKDPKEAYIQRVQNISLNTIFYIIFGVIFILAGIIISGVIFFKA